MSYWEEREQGLVLLAGPLEIAQLGGLMGGVPHRHMTLFDADQRGWGGHLERGCSVLTLREPSIRRLREVMLARRPPDQGGVKTLDLACTSR